MSDKDTNPYYLRNVDLDKLDLSSYGKDYSAEELDAVKTSLRELQKQHHAEYEALPLADKAQMYAIEKFGNYQKYAEQNPEIAYGAPAAAVGGTAILGAQKLFGSLRDKISSLTNSTAAPLPDDAILAKQMPEKPVVAAAPSTPAPISQETPPAAVKGVDKTPDQIRKEKLAQAQAQLEGRAATPAAPTAPAPTPSAQTMTPKQLIEAAQPASYPEGVTPETEVGKPYKEMPLVERGAANTEINAANKKVTAAEKALAQQGAVMPAKPQLPVVPKSVLKAQAAKGSYLNMFGYQASNPDSPQSIGAKKAYDLFFNTELEGKTPKSNPDYPNKFKGLPEFHKEKYLPFVQQNMQNFDPATQSYLNKSMAKNAQRSSEALAKAGVPIDKQAGKISTEALGTTLRGGLAGLAVIPAINQLRQGNYKEALNEIIPAVGLANPLAGLVTAPLYTSPEERALMSNMSLKELEEYKTKVGAGRGIAPPQR